MFPRSGGLLFTAPLSSPVSHQTLINCIHFPDRPFPRPTPNPILMTHHCGLHRPCSSSCPKLFVSASELPANTATLRGVWAILFSSYRLECASSDTFLAPIWSHLVTILYSSGNEMKGVSS
ncbi:hypothetical protein M758_10G024500 [Ceratodon purpureus]|nr:hypothetical protein M758_10G024500 [Ceratodon purpureus]